VNDLFLGSRRKAEICTEKNVLTHPDRLENQGGRLARGGGTKKRSEKSSFGKDFTNTEFSRARGGK